MTDDTELGAHGAFEEKRLIDYLRDQRWFGANTRDVSGADGIDIVPLGSDQAVALVDVHFRAGSRDLYQLLVEEREATLRETTRPEELARRLVMHCASDESIATANGHLNFKSIRPLVGMEAADAHAIDADQSNTSMVVGNLMLKTYRRVEAGVNPELEMLLFFAEHGFERVPPLVGWYGYEGVHIDATLGIVQCFLDHTVDGWRLGLDEGTRDATRFTNRIEDLGAVIGAMHSVLASDSDDPSFAPEEPTPESGGLLTARIGEEIDAIFDDFSEREEIAPLVGHRDDAHALLKSLGGSLPPGRMIRTHGDLHLGQTLWDGDHWTVIDFEGEPARPASSRRQKAHPLRDVAGMLRSLSYLASMLEQRGAAPGDWEPQARDRFVSGYRDTAPAAVLPASTDAQERQLGIFELEKAFYELRYELDHRPDFVPIPVRSILSLLDRGVA